MLDRLSKTLTDAGIPLERVNGVTGSPILVFQTVATAQQITDANAIVATFDWSPVTHAAWIRTETKKLDEVEIHRDIGIGRVLRAILGTLIAELNRLRSPVIEVDVFTWNPPNLTGAAGATSPDVPMIGARFGDCVSVCAPYDLAGVTVTGYVKSNDVVSVRLQNGTGVAVNFDSGQWKVVVTRHTRMPPITANMAKTALVNSLQTGEFD